MANKKGMSMALTLVVTAVVLIVISLVIITIVTGGLTKFSGSQTEQMNETSTATSDAIAIAYCNAQKGMDVETCCAATYGGETCESILGGTGSCGGTCLE
ncbi:MAG: hypothetical protein U9P44_01455 [archaeon]|nr:hypothetical protein [archaeon]